MHVHTGITLAPLTPTKVIIRRAMTRNLSDQRVL